MRNLILFDTDDWQRLLPLTYTRPQGELRCGALLIREKWELLLNGKASYVTQEYLTDRFPITIKEDNWLIHGSALPTDALLPLIHQLDQGEALLLGEELIAARMARSQFDKLLNNEEIENIEGYAISPEDVRLLQRPSDILTYNPG